MKKKVLLVLIPLILTTISGCVKYNGQGKPGKKSSSDAEQSSEVTPSSGEVIPSSDVELSSSVAPQPSSDPVVPSDELPAGTEVKVYLVFGEYGLYKGNPVNTKIESMFLEHTVEFSGKVGELLPNDEVTSSVDGSHFVCWVAYNNDGKLTEYLKVPGYQNKILYASFTGGKGGGQGGGSHGGGGEVVPPTPGEYTPSSTGALPTSGFGFKFSDDSYMAAVRTNDDNGFQQHLINHRSFSKDQVFQLYDFENNAGWTVDIDPWSFGGNAESTNWKAYIAHNYSTHTYTVLQDFNVESIYIKLKYGEDQIYFQLA